MAILLVLVKVVAVWSSLAVVTGFALAALIQRGERSRKDLFLTCLFATIEALQTSQG